MLYLSDKMTKLKPKKNYSPTELHFKDLVKRAFVKGNGEGISYAMQKLFLFRKKRKAWYKKQYLNPKPRLTAKQTAKQPIDIYKYAVQLFNGEVKDIPIKQPETAPAPTQSNLI